MNSLERIKTYAAKNGFIYSSSEIYGGLSGFYDYGHLGKALKNNFENLWRDYFLSLDINYVEIEANEVMHEKVFQASGHLKNFVDPVAISKKGNFERADHLIEENTGEKAEGLSTTDLLKIIKEKGLKSSVDGTEIVKVEVLNLMFPLTTGTNSTAYLRPETAQSPYVNFKRQHEAMRKTMPLGLATIGKAYRNEISPRNFIIRQRGFTQAELQIFFDPETINEQKDFEKIKDYELIIQFANKRKENPEKIKCSDLAKKIPKKYVYHMAIVQKFYFEVLKLNKKDFKLAELIGDEKAFYNKYHFDIEYNLGELGWIEIGGIHYRTDHDLSGHQKVSGEKMSVVDDKTGRKFVPHVLELSFGVDRNIYSILYSSLTEKEGNTLLKINKDLSPQKIAVLPLLKNKEVLVEKSDEVYKQLKNYKPYYDASGSIGKRYARQDEIGTPYCVTIDFDTLDDESVTVRERDTSKQERVKIKELNNYFERVL